jgi:hypothetical protein
VQVLGDGLSNGHCGDELQFQIKPKSPTPQSTFSATSCQVTFEGPSKPEIRFENAPDNTVNCAWLPKLPGQYKVTIRYNGEQVSGSPFTCHVSGSSTGEQLQAQQLAKIVCSGPGLHAGRVSDLNQVRVNEVNGEFCGFVQLNCPFHLFNFFLWQKRNDRRPERIDGRARQADHQFSNEFGRRVLVHVLSGSGGRQLHAQHQVRCVTLSHSLSLYISKSEL